MIQFLAAILIALGALAAESGEDLCSVENLRAILGPDVPTQPGSDKFLKQLVLSPGPECVANLQKAIPERLATGRRLREEYLDFYARHFPEAMSRQLMLYPDQAVLARLKEFITSRKRPQDRTPPDYEIRNLALIETLNRYRLPQMSEDDLRRKARTENGFAGAETDFLRTYQRLRENYTVPAPQNHTGVAAWISQMVAELESLRIKNLRASVQQLPEWASTELQFKNRNSSQITKIRLEKLAQSNLHFVNGQHPDQAVQWVHSPFKKLPLSRRGEKMRVADPHPDFYFDARTRARPQIVGKNLRFTNEQHQIFELGENDFVNLLHELTSENPMDFFGEEPLVRRFLNEAAARDGLLANLIQILASQSSSTDAESLYGLLHARLKNRISNASDPSHFLTLEMQALANRGLIEGPIADLIWSGIGRHPRYWKIHAEGAGRGRFKKYSDYRLMPEKERMAWQRSRTNRLRAWWTAGSLAAGLALTQVTLPDKFDFAALLTQSTNDWDGADGNSKIDPNLERQTGKTLACGESHNPQESDHLVEVNCRVPSAPIPKYYNFAKDAHIENERGRDRDGELLFMNEGDPSSADLVVDVNFPNAPSSNRLGLPQISGYKPVALRLYDKDTRPVTDLKVKVIEVFGNRQVYAELSGFQWDWRSLGSTSYTYRISYKRRPPPSSSIDFVPSEIEWSAAQLREAGFTQLAETLAPLGRQSEPVPVTHVAAAFAAGGNYVFEDVSYPQRKVWPENLSRFTRYLHEGKLYYQCTGATNLMNEVFRNILNEQWFSGIEIESVAGLMANADGHTRRGLPGHQHTILYGRHFDAFEELDGTPYRGELSPPAGPASASWTARMGRVAMAWQDSPLQPAPLPKAPRLSDRSRSEDDEQPPTPLPLTGLSPERIAQTLKLLKQTRDDVSTLAETALKSRASLSAVPLSQIYGLELLPLSARILRAFEPNASDRDLPTQDFLRERMQKLESLLKRLDGPASADLRALEFLTENPLRSKLLEFAKLLTSQNWPELLQKSTEMKKSCADQLEGGAQ